MLKLKKNEGITLIALVITIIVLLILAGITIGQLTNSGLFDQANVAKEKYTFESVKEQLEMDMTNFKMEELLNKNDDGQNEDMSTMVLSDLKTYLESDKFNGEYEVELFYEPLAATEPTSTTPIYATVKHRPTSFWFYVDGKLIVLGGEKNDCDAVIKYDVTGGTESIDDQEARSGKLNKLKEVEITKPRYIFVGWSRTIDGEVLENNSIKLEEGETEVTVYAIWTENKFTVTYNANSGTGAPSSQTIIEGNKLTISSTIPTRDAHTFAGWSTDPNAGTGEYKSGKQYDITDNLNLYAIWKNGKYLFLEGDQFTATTGGWVQYKESNASDLNTSNNVLYASSRR